MISRRSFVRTALAYPFLSYATSAWGAGNIQKVSGAVYVNDQRISPSAEIRAGDSIVVSHDGELEFVLGEDAYRLGPRSVLTLERAGGGAVSALRLLTGAILGVFGRRHQRLPVHTAFATIGIRGTGVFVSTTPSQLYTCTCYGTTDLLAGAHNEVFSATHHNAHIVDRHGDGTMTVKASSMQGHDDEQLRRLEAYVGRRPLFDHT
jgi:hypothetical protein